MPTTGRTPDVALLATGAGASFENWWPGPAGGLANGAEAADAASRVTCEDIVRGCCGGVGLCGCSLDAGKFPQDCLEGGAAAARATEVARRRNGES